MNGKREYYPIPDRWSYLWLLLATVLALFSISVGKWIIPIAAWLGSVFMIRFFRTQRRAWLAYLLSVITTGVVVAIVLPSELSSLAPGIIIGASILGNLPLLADRWLAPRLGGFTGTLVFPLAMTGLDFLNTLTNPLGSFGALAYSQYDNLILLQLTSLTGMWGLTFLMTWFAPVVNWAWERQFSWTAIRRGVFIYAGLMLAVVIYGQARLWFAPPFEQTVRAAGFTVVDWRAEQDGMFATLENDRSAFREKMQERYQLYFDATRREARAGAQLIVWPEHAAPVAEEDEAALVAQAQDTAREEGIFLAIGMMTFPAGDEAYAAKLMVFDPRGQTVLEHYKYGGVGFEGNRINGDGVLRTAQTAVGVLSGVICWDTDYPGVVLQAGRNGTTILLSPSLDFKGLDPIHAHMAVMRAIENGVSVIRVADNGLSVIADPYGRTLASMDHFTSGDRSIIAQVPTKGVPTLYPLIGDLFGWLSIAGFVGAAVLGIVSSRRSRK